MCLATVAAAVALIILGVIFVRDGSTAPGPEELDYPPLARGEELPDPTADFYLRPETSPSSFEFDGPYPETPSEMIVYRIIRPKNVTEAYVRELAEKYFDMPSDSQLEISPPRPGGGPPLYSLKTQSHLFEYDALTGFFKILKHKKAIAVFSRDREDYPSDEECRQIATQYLKEHGLLPDDAYQSGMADNAASGAGISVGFDRMIGKYKCFGQGSEILVRVGVDGEILKVSKRWLEYEPWKIAPIKTPQQAFKELKFTQGLLESPAKVTEIILRYHTLGEDPYIQPIYYFKFGKPGAYGIVSAVKQEHLLSREETWRYIKQQATDPNK